MQSSPPQQDRPPQIVVPDPGLHNKRLSESTARLIKGSSYKDVSTIVIIPTRGFIHARIVQTWFTLMNPMNQRVIRLFAVNMEVGKAYSDMIEYVLANPELAKWKYVLTMEDDNVPPPDGLLKLYEGMHDGFDAVGGLYWTKGEGGQPMIYGNPQEMPRNFHPQLPFGPGHPQVKNEGLQPCNGLGMGFTLFKMDMLKDRRIERPLFRTAQDYIPYQGARQFTQDLYFFEHAGALGYKFACDTRVKVGHYDADNDRVW